MISFFCGGTPVTQGSLRAFHTRRVDDCIVRLVPQNSVRLEEWRALVATQAKRAMRQDAPMDGPLEVYIEFTFPPAKKGAQDGYKWGGRRDDLDKLIRACLDALDMAAVYQDDSQVASINASKKYGTPSGARVTVVPLAQ